MRGIFAVLLVFVGLAGCGPIMETRYDYQPPKSKNGMQCVQNCQQDQSSCQRHGRQQTDMCRRDAEMRAEDDYQRRMSNYIVALKLRARDPGHYPEPYEPARGYPNYFPCDHLDDHCVPQYHGCYRSCGGQVYEHQVCVANCEK